MLRPLLRLALGSCFLVPSAAAAADAKGPAKVFILAGQSNMEGKALARTLEPVIADAKTRDLFKHLKTDGKWTVRDDVWVTFLDKQYKGSGGDMPLYGPLTVGFGGYKTDLPDLQDEWNAFRANAQTNEAKPKDDPTRIDPGTFFFRNWVRRYRRELSYTSDKRYHYLGSGACYYQMGESMGKSMLELLK